jgi:hypothetical protein
MLNDVMSMILEQLFLPHKEIGANMVMITIDSADMNVPWSNGLHPMKNFNVGLFLDNLAMVQQSNLSLGR